MLLGLLTDIHEAVEELARACELFRQLGVQQVVSLGDACDTFTPINRADATVELLRSVGAVGVWGNHDFGFCNDPPIEVRARATPTTLKFLGTMTPKLVIDDCHFSHVEPWLDATKVEDLWYFDGPARSAARSFAAVSERVVFCGHFHRWLALNEAGPIDWHGDAPLNLAKPTRYLIVVAPVVSGWCATYDTNSGMLTPLRCLR